MDGGWGDPVRSRDLAEAMAVLPVTEDGFTIQGQGPAADVASLEAGSTHAGADPSDYQVRSSSAMAPMIS
jgi:hypothetical protein